MIPLLPRPLIVCPLVLAGLEEVGSPPWGVSVYEVILGMLRTMRCLTCSTQICDKLLEET